MLDAHYAGEINIANYWSVGDTRIETLEEIPAGILTEDEPYQNIELTIIDFNHDILETAIGGRSRAAVTILTSALETSNYLGSGQSSISELAIASKSDVMNVMWKNWDRRTWCNNNFFNSLPVVMRNGIKTVTKYTQTYTLINVKDVKNDTTIAYSETYIVDVDETNDKVFLLSGPETANSTITGKKWSFPSESNPSTLYKLNELSNKDNKHYYTRELYVESSFSDSESPTGAYYILKPAITEFSSCSEVSTDYSSRTVKIRVAFCL